MIAMLDTSHDLKVCEQEIGVPVEQLLTPGTRFTPQYPEEMFSIDNFGFTNFKREPFESLLAREFPRVELCRFVCAPDVVGDARRTLEVFDYWHDRLGHWPIALVAQDGQENLPIPWMHIDAIFIGGTTEWKMGRGASAIVKAGKAIGAWVHVGRVNTPDRFSYFEKLGADSIDGTGISLHSHMRIAIRDRDKSAQDKLPLA